MTRELELRLGKVRVAISVEQSTVVLCDDAAHASRMAKALADAGVRTIDGAEAPRSAVNDQLGRRADRDQIARVIAALHLPEDVIGWHPRELPTLQRMLAESLVAVVGGSDPIAFDVTRVSASLFDVSHLIGHIRRLRASFPIHVVALVANPALISSAGEYLVAMQGDTVAESGSVAQCLAAPTSDSLLRRLETTPIPSPLAMQLRRVQRASTKPVNYSHTQIITLPTQDSIALAVGDE
jgi:hypothetical protein